MSLTKESKIRVLENFYALDNIFFGKPAHKLKENLSENGKTIYEEYQSVKGAILSIAMEMYNLVGHKPEPFNEKVDQNTLSGMAQESANIAKRNAEKIITTERGREFIKEELKQETADKKKLNIKETVNEKVDQMAHKIAIDNLLIARTLYESEDVNKMNEWQGEILEDAYKVLRDSMIDTAKMLNQECQQN